MDLVAEVAGQWAGYVQCKVSGHVIRGSHENGQIGDSTEYVVPIGTGNRLGFNGGHFLWPFGVGHHKQRTATNRSCGGESLFH